MDIFDEILTDNRVTFLSLLLMIVKTLVQLPFIVFMGLCMVICAFATILVKGAKMLIVAVEDWFK